MALASVATQAAHTTRIGLIGDIQYADADDVVNRQQQRRYRNSLAIVERAVASFTEQRVDVVVNLGDMIDRKCADAGNSEICLRRVMSALDSLPMPCYNLLGNHELYNFKHRDLASKGWRLSQGVDATYGMRTVSGSGTTWDLIFLDAFDISLLGHDETDPPYREALELMQQNIPNADAIVAETVSWFTAGTQWLPCAGAVSARQLGWLKGTLASSKEAGRTVLVFSHVPVYEPASQLFCLMWNYREVLEVLHEYSDTVCAVIAGHDHNGGYAMDERGIHHITMCAPLCAERGADCWATVELADEEAWLHCAGMAVKASGGSGWYPKLNLRRGADNSSERLPISS